MKKINKTLKENKKSILIIGLIIVAILASVFFYRKNENDKAKVEYTKLKECLSGTPWQISADKVEYDETNNYSKARDCLISYNNNKESIKFNSKEFETNLDGFVEAAINEINALVVVTPQQPENTDSEVPAQEVEAPEIETDVQQPSQSEGNQASQTYIAYLANNEKELDHI